MPAEITQKNLYLLLPGKVACIASIVAENQGIPLKEALVSFYCSEAYSELERESSKYWHLSPEQFVAEINIQKCLGK